MDISIWIFGALAVIVLICEYFNGKQRAETEDKIDEIHRWLKRCHPYRYNGFTDEETKIIKDRIDNNLEV